MSRYLFIGGPAHGKELTILHGDSAILYADGERQIYRKATALWRSQEVEIFVHEQQSPAEISASLAKAMNQRTLEDAGRNEWCQRIKSSISDEAGETLLMGRKLQDLTDYEARIALYWFASNRNLISLPPPGTNRAR